MTNIDSKLTSIINEQFPIGHDNLLVIVKHSTKYKEKSFFIYVFEKENNEGSLAYLMIKLTENDSVFSFDTDRIYIYDEPVFDSIGTDTLKKLSTFVQIKSAYMNLFSSFLNEINKSGDFLQKLTEAINSETK